MGGSGGSRLLILTVNLAQERPGRPEEKLQKNIFCLLPPPLVLPVTKNIDNVIPGESVLRILKK
jgi:hypothetical protein